MFISDRTFYYQQLPVNWKLIERDKDQDLAKLIEGLYLLIHGTMLFLVCDPLSQLNVSGLQLPKLLW